MFFSLLTATRQLFGKLLLPTLVLGLVAMNAWAVSKVTSIRVTGNQRGGDVDSGILLAVQGG